MEFKKLTPEEVIIFLKANMEISNTVESQIKSEQVDGMTLLELNEDELKLIGFSTLGQRKAVLRILNKEKVEKASVAVHLHSQNESVRNFSNLKEVFCKDHESQELLNEIELLGFLNNRNRKLFIKKCTDILNETAVEHGYKRNYPPNHMKTEMAIAIVDCFPQLKCELEGSSGYEHYYDHLSGSGYIENRLKTIRKKMPLEEKAYKKRKYSMISESSSGESSLEISIDSDSTVDIRDSEEMMPIKEKVMWLRQAVPSTDNIKLIYEEMAASFDYRRQEITADQPSITSILQHYPRFVDVDQGALIDKDFELLFPKAKSIKHDFSIHAEKIIKLGHRYSLNFTETNLKAIMVLQKLLPPLNTKAKKSEAFAVIVFKGAGCDPNKFANEKPASLQQPFLLATGSQTNPNDFFLILDHTALPVGNNVLSAMQRLFASFWVFGIEYYPRLTPFYNFWESLLLQKTPICSVRSLMTAVFSGTQ